MRKIAIIILLGFINLSLYSQNSGCISGDCDNGFGTFIFGKDTEWSGNEYEGYWKNGTMHGKGTYTWANGDKYIGNWKYGLQHGDGKFYKSNGEIIYGVWEEGALIEKKTNKVTSGCISGDCNNGFGTYVWSNGDKYVGYWNNQKMEGEGSINFSSGASYAGEFKNGKREGKGTYIWADGEKYIGDWKENKQHGIGTIYYSDGTIEKGVFENGKYIGKSENLTGCISGDCENGFGTYIWGDGEKYVGNWKNSMRNGQGTNISSSGAKFIGEWKNDIRHGYGTLYEVGGDVKKGIWEEDKYIGTGQNNYGCISGDCNNGYGIYTWEEGDNYEGEWKNFKQHGEGTYKYASGAIYKGKWINGIQTGYGTYTYNEDSKLKKYIGDFKDGKFEGYGTLIWKSGEKYVGEFKNNLRHGEGTTFFTNGTSKSGVWNNDVFTEKQKIKSGCIAGDCSNGYGTYLYETGNKYTGTFKGGNFEGQGTFTFVEGDEYVGQFKNGTYEGQGTYSFANGQKYVGNFVNGSFHGNGTMYYPNGEEKNGLWENGEYTGPVNKINPPAVTWLKPQYFNTNTKNQITTVKLCIKSDGELQNVQIYVNDKLQINNATRGYSVVTTDCDYTLEKKLTLDQGENTIKVIVTNEAGTVTSDVRNIKYEVEAQPIAQKRLALIIGNANYTTSPLKNPANDAEAIAIELKKLGFEVMVYTNLGQNDMKVHMRTFGNKLAKDKGVGLFYFAGHGLQLNGENYLVPVDAQIEKEQDVELESVNLKRILGEMDYAQNDLNIVILDACRNNPFARSFRSKGNNGLATTIAPQGTFIAYATAPGSVASDGDGDNGLYTEELIKALKIPNIKIEDVFKKVRQNVYIKSNKKQVPWENSSIFGDFYFKKQ